MLDEHAPAERSYLESRDLLESAGTDAKQQAELARIYNNLGILLKSLGRFPEAKQDLERARELRAALVQESPKQSEYVEGLAESWYHLGAVLARLPKQ